jgi:hypothetical protein
MTPIPGNPFTGSDAPANAYGHLERFHGVKPGDASYRLHRIKGAAGLGPNEDVVIGRTGDVYNSSTGEHLGSLTDQSLGFAN